MSQDQNYEDKDDRMHCMMGESMKKEFKLAMLDKKEQIMKAQLEFIGKMRKLIEKMPESKE